MLSGPHPAGARTRGRSPLEAERGAQHLRQSCQGGRGIRVTNNRPICDCVTMCGVWDLGVSVCVLKQKEESLS